MRRIRARIKQLEDMSTTPAEEPVMGLVDGIGVKIEDRPDINRVTVVFAYRPERGTCKRLKGQGFRWSRTEGAWLCYRGSHWKAVALLDRPDELPRENLEKD